MAPPVRSYTRNCDSLQPPTAAAEVAIIAYSTGASTRSRFPNIADDLKKKARFEMYTDAADVHTHTSCAVYSLFTSPAFAVT